MEPGVVFGCGKCSKTFAKRMDYNRHQKSHERPHKCSICDRSFGLKTDRDSHRTTHSAVRSKFMCTFPGCRFKGASRKNYLLKHMQTSHGDTKDPTTQKTIRLHYQQAPNATISQAEEKYLHLLEAVNLGNESGVKEFILMNASLLAMSRRGAAAGGLAAAKGHLNILKMIVEAGVDVNINTSEPWLHQALRNQHFTIAEFLIKSGADVDAKSSENQTAFEAAVLRGCELSVSLLHQSGADLYPGSDSKARLGAAVLSGTKSWMLLLCETGIKDGEDPAPGETDLPQSHWYRVYKNMGLGRFAIAKRILAWGATLGGRPDLEIILQLPEVVGDLLVESVSEFGSSIREIPRSRKEPETTVLSSITYDNGEIIQLLLEERTTPKGRYLWERIVWFRTSLLLDGSDIVIRLLREWGPLSTVES
ncbi:ankyrin [Stipitochalara longipes BDJ]|nr:ankyrin [Stipitochalara longipes BDJ]